MAEYEKAVRKILSENGCRFFQHGKGDHDIWHSSINILLLRLTVKLNPAIWQTLY